MKLNKYQTTQQVINEVQSPTDVEALRTYIAETAATTTDEWTLTYLDACRKALEVYDQRWFRRWSTPFLQRELDVCRQQGPARYIELYEAELYSRQ